MRHGLTILSLAVLAAAWPVSGALAASDTKNALPNASFEEAPPRVPKGWKTFTWNGKASFDCVSPGRTGGMSVTIASEPGGDAAWHANATVTPYSTYRLSAWIKTENLKATTGQGALLNLHDFRKVRTPAVTGTTDWKRVEIEFETGGRDSVQVNCLFGGWGLATGRAWYDDVQLERVSTHEPRPEVFIDATQTGEPISKYIYGQFIEHLGRCIYGGIWAEMLEDRKFYYAIGAKHSPWKPIGGVAAVEMIRAGSLVGEFTPNVQLAADDAPRGIVQAGLGLRKGLAYEGRVVLAGTAQAGPVEVNLIWGDRPDDRQTVTIREIADTYNTTPIRFTAGADTDDARLEIVGRGKGTLRIGTASLMPADNVHGMRADTLKLLRELDSPLYRWPGGNFVSGYNWRDGIGDRDRRPPRKNPAWAGIEPNDFGIDDFLLFCREINTEPLIVVNTGLGGARLAADEVEYVNGAPDTPMGRLRAKNGHPEPYKVEWWGIGNEMYGGWQLGYMPLADYVQKHNVIVDAMRAIDPKIRVVAVGAAGDWSEQTLTHCADHMDLISEHFYVGRKPGPLSHMRQMPDRVRAKADAHRRYRKTIDALKGKDIRIALDEWNYWYGPHEYGDLGTRYFLRDGIGVAAGLHELARNSEMFFMANHAQTVNVIGAIKTTKTAAEFETTGLALKLYRRHFGVIPVTVGGKPQPLDVAAAWAENRKALTIAIVNPLPASMKLVIDLKGASLAGTGRLWRITGPNDMAYNEPGKPRQVEIVETPVTSFSDRVEVPPISVSLYSLTVR